MSIESKILDRIDELLREAASLSKSTADGAQVSEEIRHQCGGWMASVVNIFSKLTPNSQYLAQVLKIAANGPHFLAHNQVGEMAAVLTALSKDAQAGLIGSISDHASAETFDNFLDHGEAYANEKMHREAGVIAGVAFEDSLRRVCRKRNFPEKGVKLDDLISALATAGVLSQTKAKRARVAAHVRTKATHAQWDEFALNDVLACISFTRELISSELDA